MAQKKFYVDINLQQNQLKQAAVENLASAPGTPVAGQIYFDTTLNRFGIYNGSAWIYMGDLSVIEWQDSALDYVVDNTLAPVTEITGDRYILSHDGGAPHANWDGASAGDIVEFNGTTWDALTPTTGTFISADDQTTLLYYWGGSSWVTKEFENTTASNGLTKSVNDIQLDLISLSTAGANISSASPDYFVFTDTDDSNNEKRDTIFNIFAQLAGTGLTHNNDGTLSLDFASDVEAKTGTETDKPVNPSSIADFIHTYSDAFIVGDWVGTGSPEMSPWTLQYIGSTTNILTPKHIDVKDNTGDEVIVNVNVTGSTVTLTSNATFAGTVEISGKGYTA